MAGEVERRDKHPNPGNKIGALLCQPKALNTVPVGPAGSRAGTSAREGDSAVEEAGALPEVNRIRALQNPTDWTLQPTGTSETSIASGGGSSGSHSRCYHCRWFMCLAEPKTAREVLPITFHRWKIKMRLKEFKCFAPDHTARK